MKSPQPFLQWPRVGSRWPSYNLGSNQAKGLTGLWVPHNYYGVRGFDLIANNNFVRTSVVDGYDPILGPTMVFDGLVAECIFTTNAFSFPMTISIWVKPDVSNPLDIILHGSQTTGDGWGAESETHLSTNTTVDGKFDFFCKTGATVHIDTNNLEDPAAFVAGQVYHVAVVLDTVARLYKNGVEVDNHTITGTPSFSSYGQTYLGGPVDNVRRFPGHIGPLAIYNRALSAKEIYSLYDPATRWELYEIPRRVWAFVPPAGGATVVLSTLTLASSAQSLTVVPGGVSLAMNTISLAGSVVSLTVVPGGVSVTTTTLSLAGSVVSLTVSVTGGGITVTLTALTLGSSAQSLAVTPGAVALLLNTLTLANSVEALSIVATALQISADNRAFIGFRDKRAAIGFRDKRAVIEPEE